MAPATNSGEIFVGSLPDRERMASLPLPEILSALSASEPTVAQHYAAEIIRRFEPLMRVTWRGVGGLAADYDDFVQEAFLKLFRALPQLRDRNAFPGFFRMVLLNVARDQLRRRTPKGTEDVPLDEVPEPILERDSIADIDRRILLTSVLEKLKGRDHGVLYLDAILGLTSKEIAKRLGITEGAVRVMRSRAIHKIRQELGETHDALDAKKRRDG
jgi:RNA polymerase sigma-70 factor, ECF subfamily